MWQNHTLDPNILYFNTDGSSISTAHFKTTKILRANYRRTLTVATLHLSPDEGEQKLLCVNSPSTSGNHAIKIEYTEDILGYTSGTDKGSLEHPFTKQEDSAEKVKIKMKYSTI